MMRRTMRWSIAIIAWLAATSANAQETAAVVAVGGSPEIVVDDWNLAAVGVSDELEHAGYGVAVGAVRDHEHSPQGCISPECLATERERLGVSVLGAVIVWAGADVHDRAGSLVVILTNASGSFDATADVVGGDARLAARAATIEARANMARGGHPFVRVTGSPRAALIVIDGVETAGIPWEGAVSLGHHTIEVRHGGYVSETREVDVGASTLDLSFSLVAIGGGSGGGLDVPWLIAGGASAAAGVALAVVGALTLTQPTTCDATGHCTEAAVVGGAVELGLGGALLIFGAIGLVLGVTASSGSSAQAHFDVRSLTLHF